MDLRKLRYILFLIPVLGFGLGGFFLKDLIISRGESVFGSWLAFGVFEFWALAFLISGLAELFGRRFGPQKIE